ATRLSTSRLLDDLRHALLQRSRDRAVDVRLRIEAAEALGPLGDPRYDSHVGPEGARFLVPTAFVWVSLAAGARQIGGDVGGDPDEALSMEVVVDAFEMAFAFVTNAEFVCFVE